MCQDRIPGLTLTIMLFVLASTPALAATSGVQYAGVGMGTETTLTDYPYEAPVISADGRFVAFASVTGVFRLGRPFSFTTASPARPNW